MIEQKIITLVGYDDIPYSNFTRLEEKVEKILSRFNASTFENPKKRLFLIFKVLILFRHYVAINPASVYIGKLFRLALKLGFSTIGVVYNIFENCKLISNCVFVRNFIL